MPDYKYKMSKLKQCVGGGGSVDTLKIDSDLCRNGFIAGREKCWSHCFCYTQHLGETLNSFAGEVFFFLFFPVTATVRVKGN